MTAWTARGNALWWGTLAVLCAVLLTPLTLTDVPPLLDYPNHLARLFVLAFAATDPILARFYEPHWAIIPNLALDLIVPPLLRDFPIHTVGRVVAGTFLLLPVLGAAAYHRALGRRLSYWPLAAVLFTYNALSLRGFLNFCASIGLALLLAAAWVAWRERRPSIAILIAAAGAVGLFFSHLMGLIFFAILIGSYEASLLRGGLPMLLPFLPRIAIVLEVFAAPAILYAASDLGQLGGATDFRSVADKAQAALTPVINYFWLLDLASAAICVAIPALCLALRWCVVPFQAGLALAVLVLLFIVTPTAFKGTFDLDTRFIVMAATLAPAALVPVALPRRAAWAFGLCFFVLFGVRMTVVASVWDAWAGDLASFRAVIAPVQAGDVVLTVHLPHAADPTAETSAATPTAGRLSDGTVMDTHLPALLLIEHRAWWPFLFDNASQQPIETREPFRSLTARVNGTSDPIGLLTRDAPEMGLFTHVLVYGTAPGTNLKAREGLRPVTHSDTAALFAVTPEAPNRRSSRPDGAAPGQD